MQDVDILVTRIGREEGRTTPAGCHMAAGLAMRNAMEKGGTLALEPIMRVEVSVPDDFLGNAISLFNMRNGRVEHLSDRAGLKTLSKEWLQCADYSAFNGYQRLCQPRDVRDLFCALKLADFPMNMNDYVARNSPGQQLSSAMNPRYGTRHVDMMGIEADDHVLEIGPGPGGFERATSGKARPATV